MHPVPFYFLGEDVGFGLWYYLPLIFILKTPVAIDYEVDTQIDASIAKAKEAPFPDASDFSRGVFA